MTTERLGAARARLARALPLPGLGLRPRILAWYVLLLALATAASIVVTRQVLVVRVDQRIDAELVQESRELRRLAGGRDPATGEPFGTDVARVFEVFLQRNTPSRREALLTFLGGDPYLRAPATVPYRLDLDAELTARWGAVAEPERGRVQTPAGAVDFLAVPLVEDERTLGVFVVAHFRDLERDELDAAIWAAGGVGIAMLLIGSVLAWRLAERLLERVERVTSTARAISETDLESRIEIGGRDELSHLARTFNAMLDRLEAVFLAQRRLVDDVGHELRTPITIARGHLELLGDDPDERRETVALVLDELDRMARLVDDLLVLAKAQQPDFLELETVDAGALVEEIRAKAVALAERDWRVEGHGRGIVVVDRQRLTQALMQLAQNAVDHAGQSATIALGSDVRDGEARFWVRDDGGGIPPGDRERVFERFSRGAAGSAEGAGLGLSIVRAIAEAHHGRVELESDPGRGAVFTVVVPTDQPPGGAERRPE